MRNLGTPPRALRGVLAAEPPIANLRVRTASIAAGPLFHSEGMIVASLVRYHRILL